MDTAMADSGVTAAKVDMVDMVVTADSAAMDMAVTTTTTI